MGHQIKITREQAADRIALFADEGRLVQSAWHAEKDGRHLACLLGSIDESINSPGDCPAAVMPGWMAELLPTLFDGVRSEVFVSYGKRFAAALRCGNTDDTVLRRFLIRSIEYSVDQARECRPAGQDEGMDAEGPRERAPSIRA